VSVQWTFIPAGRTWLGLPAQAFPLPTPVDPRADLPHFLSVANQLPDSSLSVVVVVQGLRLRLRGRGPLALLAEDEDDPKKQKPSDTPAERPAKSLAAACATSFVQHRVSARASA
jgi:hypothetical protein